ncbi:hypothetical protein DRN34_05440 [Thermococci archaeon]|nr:MAG: hypothetical protein DRN34_05440 [Thermococci archaeon]
MDLRLEHKFGPGKGHYRVVESQHMDLSYEELIALVQELNDRAGVERKGRTIFPRIGQKYFTVRRKK